mgnify:CR=1 FL=1
MRHYRVFSHSGEYVTSLYSTLDLNDYPNGEISLIADTSGEGCKCVKLSFAGTTREERVAPYALYGGINGSFNTGSPGGNDPTTETLEAWAYTDKACSVQSGNMSIQDLLIIPTTVPKQNTVTATPITVVYESTTGPVTDAETDEAVASTCDYFEDTLGYGMVYKSDIGLQEYECSGSALQGTAPLKIQFDITASFSKLDGFNPYTNRLLPNQEEVDKTILYMLQGGTAGPGIPSLPEYLKETLSEDNPYHNLTGVAPA